MAGHVQKYLQLHQEAPVQRDVEACCTAYLYSYLVTDATQARVTGQEESSTHWHSQPPDLGIGCHAT